MQIDGHDKGYLIENSEELKEGEYVFTVYTDGFENIISLGNDHAQFNSL